MGWLTDTHCHLNLNTFQEDLEPILERAWERGIDRILVPGSMWKPAARRWRWPSAMKTCMRQWASTPAMPAPGRPTPWLTLRELAQHPKVVAIGEIGLDYYRDRSPRPLQRQVFQAQLELAGGAGAAGGHSQPGVDGGYVGRSFDLAGRAGAERFRRWPDGRACCTRMMARWKPPSRPSQRDFLSASAGR